MGYHLTTADDVETRQSRPRSHSAKYTVCHSKTAWGPIFIWVLSTKYTDEEAGLVYYGHRYYVPENGRWLGRDPIGLLAVANLYDFVKQNPITRVDPLGLWDFIVHRNWTAYWAGQNGYSMQSKTGVSEADEAVDGFWGGTGPLPGVGDQSYHFNTAGAGGGDTRITHSNTDLDAAKAACNWANSKDDYEEARKMLGRSLHAMQDWVAHGDYNSGGSSFYQHNTGGPVSADASPGRSPDDYPDDVALDAKGSPDGRVTSSFIDANDHAVFVGGHKRFNLTADKSKPILQALIQFVQSNARPLPCGKCRKYFLSEDAP